MVDPNKMQNIKSLLKKAQDYCDQNQHRFTDPRRLVLEILANNEKPMGAYDVLDQLGQYIDNPKPPTAYRAIDFWKEHGFVHKIESLNSYITCCEDHTHDNTHFLVCDDCNNVEEIHTHRTHAETLPDGFVAKKTFTETHGVCGECTK